MAKANWQSETTSMISRTSHLLMSELMSDVRIYVGPDAVEYPAHKLLLSIASPVFERKFRDCLAEHTTRVRVREISPAVFQKLLEYIYTDKIELVSVNEAHDLCCAAETFEMAHLAQMCQKYIRERHIPADMACKVFESALDLNMPRIAELCRNTFVNHTKEVLCSQQFRATRLSTLEEIVRSNCLNIDSEYDLIKAVVNWSRAECERGGIAVKAENIREKISPLICHLRFLTLTWEEFQDFLEDFGVLSSLETFALTVRLMKPGRSLLPAVPLPPSLCPHTEKRLRPEATGSHAVSASNPRQGACKMFSDEVIKNISSTKPIPVQVSDSQSKGSTMNSSSNSSPVSLLHNSHCKENIATAVVVPPSSEVEEPVASKLASYEDENCEGTTSGDSDSEEEDCQDDIARLGECRACELDLDTSAIIPDGATISDVASNVVISVSSGKMKLVGLVVQANHGILSRKEVLIRVSSGAQSFEKKHNIAESDQVYFPKFLSLQLNEEAHIQVMAENIQLHCCPVGTACDVILNDHGLKFVAKVSGNRKIQGDKILHMIKRILYIRS